MCETKAEGIQRVSYLDQPKGHENFNILFRITNETIKYLLN